MLSESNFSLARVLLFRLLIVSNYGGKAVKQRTGNFTTWQKPSDRSSKQEATCPHSHSPGPAIPLPLENDWPEKEDDIENKGRREFFHIFWTLNTTLSNDNERK